MKSLALAFLLFATAAIEIDTQRIADGGIQTFTSGSRRVAVHKLGDTTTIVVEEGDRVDTVTFTRNADGQLDIGRRDNGAARRFIQIDRPKIVVDGIDIEPYLMESMTVVPHEAPAPKIVPLPDRLPKPMPNDANYHICPKDGTMLVVPSPNASGTYNCPVDGTPMKAGVGPGRKYFLID